MPEDSKLHHQWIWLYIIHDGRVTSNLPGMPVVYIYLGKNIDKAVFSRGENFYVLANEKSHKIWKFGIWKFYEGTFWLSVWFMIYFLQRIWLCLCGFKTYTVLAEISKVDLYIISNPNNSIIDFHIFGIFDRLQKFVYI